MSSRASMGYRMKAWQLCPTLALQCYDYVQPWHYDYVQPWRYIRYYSLTLQPMLQSEDFRIQIQIYYEGMWRGDIIFKVLELSSI